MTRVAAHFTSLDDVLLAVRALGWASVLPTLKRVLPLRSLVQLMRTPPTRTTRSRAREDRIVTFANWACRITRASKTGNCLERGLIAYRLLGAARAEPRLAVGVGRENGGAVRGHAWVIVDGQPVGESAASLAEFSPVVVFDEQGRALTECAAPAVTP